MATRLNLAAGEDSNYFAISERQFDISFGTGFSHFELINWQGWPRQVDREAGKVLIWDEIRADANKKKHNCKKRSRIKLSCARKESRRRMLTCLFEIVRNMRKCSGKSSYHISGYLVESDCLSKHSLSIT
jgi:hypothetical protein